MDRAAAGRLDRGGRRNPAPDYRLARQDVTRLPDIALVTMQKRTTTLARELETEQPLWLNFVFDLLDDVLDADGSAGGAARRGFSASSAPRSS
ncbi:MAG: hypothetical protein U1F25_09880 [Rubrivivax sp.]